MHWHHGRRRKFVRRINHHHVLEQSPIRGNVPCVRVAPPADFELPLRSKGERAEGQGGRAKRNARIVK